LAEIVEKEKRKSRHDFTNQPLQIEYFFILVHFGAFVATWFSIPSIFGPYSQKLGSLLLSQA